MPKKKIPFINPIFPHPDQVAEDIREIIGNNYYSNNGPFYYRFKEAVERYVGQGVHASLMSNATQALILVLNQLMLTGKKYVFVPSFTFSAGPLAIKWAGFEPLFIDIHENDAQPHYKQVEELLQSKDHEVAGILMCNTFGIGAADIDQWERIAKEYGLPMVIDSASGFGSVYTDGQKLGARGDCEIFSMHITKPFGVGEGAIVSSRNETLISLLEKLKNFGFDETKNTAHMGSNAKIDEISCAIGLRLLPTLGQTIAKRQRHLARYHKALGGQDIGFVKHDINSALQFAPVVFHDPARKKRVLHELHKNDIDAKAYYTPPVHEHSFFKDCKRLALENTRLLSERIISLPVSPGLHELDIDRINNIILQTV